MKCVEVNSRQAAPPSPGGRRCAHAASSRKRSEARQRTSDMLFPATICSTRSDRGGRASERRIEAGSVALREGLVIPTDAGADFFLTEARDRLAFSFNDGSARAGVYVADLP